MANSYASLKWSKTNIFSLLNHWIVCHEIFYRDREYLKNLFILKYEDFVRAPDLCMGEVFDFLRIPDCTRTVEVYKDVNEKYFEQWISNINDRNWFKQKVKTIRYRKIDKKINKFNYSLFKIE